MRDDTLATLTGTTLPTSVTSSSSGTPMTVLMESDGSNHLTGVRWEVTPVCEHLSEGDFTTPGYDGDGYPNAADLCWSFQAPVGHTVNV